MNSMVAQKKYLGFDAVRGVAALLVFIFHFYSLAQLKSAVVMGFDLSFLAQAGHVGLDFFFVLSGFLIFRSVYLHGVNWHYFKRRWLRIAPLYYLSIVIAVFLLNPHIWLEGLSGTWNILAHLFFLQSFSPSTYYGINPVLWSLSIEMVFYLFLPLFFLFTKKSTKRIVGIAILMIVATYLFRWWITQYYGGWNSTEKIIFTENFTGRADHFAFGILAALASIKLANRALLKKLSPLLLLGGGCGVFIGMQIFAQLGNGFRDVLMAQVFLHSLIAFSMAVFLFGLAGTFSFFKKIIGNPLLEFFGMISYSFYVWHFLIIENILKLEMGTFRSFICSFLATVVLSTVTFFLVEKPFLQEKKY